MNVATGNEGKVEFMDNEKEVNYYVSKNEKKKMPTWAKALIIIAAIIVFCAVVAKGCSNFTSSITSQLSSSIYGSSNNAVTTNFGHDYIGTVHVEGTIDEAGSGTYNHSYILNAIDAMINDEENKGLILYVDTPGGSVFASDELYFKILEYKKTGRPVYSSMQSMAASGGYYISAPSDKIVANRNCWTGSIGVTLGTMYDVSELLDALGIKTQTITSGDNKAMGSSTEAMSREQREIFQSLVDEAYEQFVGIVSEGRNMELSKVKKLADGRIYTAKQAKEVGLVDMIGTYEDAINDMKKEYKLDSCQVEEFISTGNTDIFSLLGIISEKKGSSLMSIGEIREIVELNGSFEISYLSKIQK